MAEEDREGGKVGRGGVSVIEERVDFLRATSLDDFVSIDGRYLLSKPT